ncbi:MAG: paraquat-inducible protein A [Myxococcota bacterium]|nr:paraquat-inducible protein A [Myxococcota bacterium]
MKSERQASATENGALAGSLGGVAFVLTGLLLGALVCNILALIYPFLEFSAAFRGKEFYSIPLTISLMWDFGLYAAAILVVAFSLTFPFVKLAMLLATLWIPMSHSLRRRMLVSLRNLGRWSLLDVFIVVTILVLADDQIFVGAVPRVGVTLFLIAICTSMLTCEILDSLSPDGKEADPSPVIPGRYALYSNSGWTYGLMLILFLATTVSLFAAIGLPYFHISQFLLKHKAYSVIESVMALAQSGSLAFALTIMVFLVIFPVARISLMAAEGFIPLSRETRSRLSWWSGIIGAWSMLDVFVLALLLFMLEGDRLIAFEVRGGLYMLIISVGLYYLTLFMHASQLRRASRTKSQVSA